MKNKNAEEFQRVLETGGDYIKKVTKSRKP
jgi:hypothetical protein